MKTHYITSLIVLLSSCGYAQVTTQLNENNVNARISDDGYFFSDSQNSVAAYEIPAGSGTHAIYSGSFWFGGTDINGQLKLAAQQYQGNGNDYYTGPIYRPLGISDSVISNYFGQTIWKVSQAEIDDHIVNYQSSTYTMPNDIANWPAHCYATHTSGGAGLPFLAPFVDVNGNGTYDPSNGDYPCIKGDLAVYTILNDAGLHFASFASPLGMELHCMFYQFTSIPELTNVTFMDMEVLNMSTLTIYDSKASFFLDTDLGNYQDDYVGTDTVRNMLYAYNADNFDETNGGALGYGNAPPAIGLKILSHDLSASMSYSNSAPFPQGDPNDAGQMYAAMCGNYLDGSDQLDGQGNPTNFTYYGDPNNANSWSEFQLSNSPGDRRFVASIDAGVLPPDFTTGATDRRTFSYAIIYAKGTDHLNSVTELQSSADFVQSHYDAMSTSCFDLQVAGIQEMQELEFSVYPSPNSGTFTLQLADAQKATIRIVDAQGRVIHTESISGGSNTISAALQSGVYFLQVASDNAASMKRIVIQ